MWTCDWQEGTFRLNNSHYLLTSQPSQRRRQRRETSDDDDATTTADNDDYVAYRLQTRTLDNVTGHTQFFIITLPTVAVQNIAMTVSVCLPDICMSVS